MVEAVKSVVITNVRLNGILVFYLVQCSGFYGFVLSQEENLFQSLGCVTQQFDMLTNHIQAAVCSLGYKVKIITI